MFWKKRSLRIRDGQKQTKASRNKGEKVFGAGACEVNEGRQMSMDVHKRTRRRPRSLQHLNATVLVVAHDYAPVAVDGNARRIVETSCLLAVTADGADVRSVSIIQNLHRMIPAINNNQMAGAIKRDTVSLTQMGDGDRQSLFFIT